MKDLIILSGGRHGEELAYITERVNKSKKTWNLLGFLTTEKRFIGQDRGGYPVLGTVDRLAKFPKAYIVPDQKWPDRYALPSDRLVSLVDPSSCVFPSAKIGLGCVIYPHCFIGDRAQLGNFVFCLSHTVINHDVVIKDGVMLASRVSLAGYTKVESECYLGQACSCREKLTIGRHSVLGMGCVVTKDVPPHSVMVGNPARKLRQVNKGKRSI